jgi:hypothetical protein
MSYQEVFKLQPPAGDKPVFYTITSADVGRATITTTAGTIRILEVLGRILPGDVDKRLYLVPCDDPHAHWIWQAENDEQRDARLETEAELVRRLHIGTPHPFRSDGNRTYCKTCGFTQDAGRALSLHRE